MTIRRRIFLLVFSALVVSGCALALQGDKLEDRSTPPLLSARQDLSLWRISCAPSEGHRIADAIASAASVEYFYDWQGGLIWMQMEEEDPRADLVRAAVRSNGGGHATLIRAEPQIKQSVSVFEPQPGPLAALSKRYRENFDPHGILNPGRMGA